MEQIYMDNIDKGCLPTFGKYVKEQLIGAIVKYIKDGDIKSFSDDYNARKHIESVGQERFKQALLEHIIKLDAAFNIVNTRLIFEYNKDYTKHTTSETELRMFETLSLVVNDVFNNHAIADAYNILTKDGVALYNMAKSFVDFRYVKAEKNKLDTAYLTSENHKNIMWKIQEFFNNKIG